MASKGEVKISVSVAATGFKRRMYFNRFHLQWLDRHALVHFGLIDESGTLRDHYACVLTKMTLRDSKAGLTAYLEKVGGPTKPKIPWTPPTGQMGIDVANIITVGQTEHAEILLSSFSVGPAIQQAKASDKPVETDPIALLACEPEIQHLVLTELYADESL